MNASSIFAAASLASLGVRTFPEPLATPGPHLMLEGKRYMLVAVFQERDGKCLHLLQPYQVSCCDES